MTVLMEVQSIGALKKVSFSIMNKYILSIIEGESTHHMINDESNFHKVKCVLFDTLVLQFNENLTWLANIT